MSYKDLEIKKCYETCATCSAGGDSSDHKCDTCDNSTYFKLDDNTKNNCVKKEE